jgi:hypothetical protein
MRTECAVLCDAASVREGLLHLLGAGVTEIAVRGFPARLPVTFAFRVVLESREIRESHTLRLELSDSTTGDVEGEVRSRSNAPRVLKRPSSRLRSLRPSAWAYLKSHELVSTSSQRRWIRHA